MPLFAGAVRLGIPLGVFYVVHVLLEATRVKRVLARKLAHPLPHLNGLQADGALDRLARGAFEFEFLALPTLTRVSGCWGYGRGKRAGTRPPLRASEWMGLRVFR